MNNKSKKILVGLLGLMPVVLASCGKAATSNDNAAYAGYEVDLDGDGTISASEKNLTWANSYDAIIKKIKGTTDETQRFKLMHAAETELMSTGAICPLYYYTDLFLKKTSMTGFFSMPLGYKFFYGVPGSFTACIASAPGTIDPALNSTVDGGTYDEHLFEGLYRWSYEGAYPNGAVKLVPGLAAAEPAIVANSDGTVTYTFTLRDGLKWSDGNALTAGDIVRSWKRAVSTTVASDYNYLFEAIKGGADAEGEADGTSLDAKATDAKTVVVTLENACSYFKELLAFPTFAPVPATADATGDWAGSKNASSFVCNGPMRIKSFGADAIVFEPNPNYYDTAMVKATEIKFAFSDDATAMLNSYKTGSYQMIDEIPQAEIATAATDYPGEYFNVGQLGTYYVCFNVNNVAFNKVADTEPKRESLRTGLSYLINRNYIVTSVTQGGEQPANGFVSKGLTGANGVGDWTDTNGANQDGKGWIDVTDTDAAFAANVEKGIAAIKAAGYSYDETAKKFTNVPSFEYLYNTSEAHKAIAEYLQSAFAKYGITMNLKNQDWATFVATRKSGDFTIARNGWLCDYNDPISMLDMWISTSGNDDVQLGKA